MQFHLNLSGGLLVALALLHIVLPRYFRWSETTGSLEPVTRQILYVHTFFIAFTVFLMGLLCLSSAPLLLTTTLGARICLGLAVFWTTRLFFQFFGYSSQLWKGKRFETAVHIVFSGLWLYLSAVFWIAAVNEFEVSRILIRARSEANLTQAEVAARISTSQAAVARLKQEKETLRWRR